MSISFLLSCLGRPVIRIALPYLFTLANSLEPLAGLAAGEPRSAAVMKVWIAQPQLSMFLNSSVYAKAIRSSRELGNALLQILGEFDVSNWEKPLESYEAFRVSNAYNQYKIALLAELGVAPSFFVSPKAPYDTMMLLDEGETILPSELSNKAPEAIFDTREAAKCLAYEAPTASGFHILRAAESVVRRYYADVSGGKAAPKVRNLMAYVRAMQSSNVGDQKILSALTQISALHRNPLMHPEDILTMGEAMALIGIVRSAVSAMLSVLPDVPQTTSTAPALSQGAP